jgi:hypothetical protein
MIVGGALVLCWLWVAFQWKEEARKTFTKHRRPLPLACGSARVFFGIFSVAAQRHIRDTYRKALGCEPHGEFTLWVAAQKRWTKRRCASGTSNSSTARRT